jgi:hypothetical protein
VKLPKIETPSPDRNAPAFRKMAREAAKSPRSDSPDRLPRDAIHEAPELFQPRFESVFYAPGRSEAHIDKLAGEARAGRPLDPVTVVAFGERWYLVDGHHRLQAYADAGWAKDIPVRAEHRDVSGPERIEWAIGLSLAENKKDRLPLSDKDKMTRAWQAVARGAIGSKSELAERYGVSDRTIANMRSAVRNLEAGGKDVEYIPSWSRAQAELRSLASHGDGPGKDFDYDEKTRRELARRLKPVMDVRARPMLLLEALEAYDPRLLDEMIAAREARRTLEEIEGGEDFDF